MNKDMARWIEAALQNTHLRYDHVTKDVALAPILKWFVVETLKAAASERVELKPREMTPKMKEAYRGTAIDPEDEWEPLFDAAPNYLDDDA